jgi:hypothetical protein
MYNPTYNQLSLINGHNFRTFAIGRYLMLKIEGLATPMGFTTPWQYCRARILCSYSALFLGTVAAHQPSTGSPMMTGPLSIAGPIKIAIINKIHMKLLMRHIKTYMNYINNDKIDIATP